MEQLRVVDATGQAFLPVSPGKPNCIIVFEKDRRKFFKPRARLRSVYEVVKGICEEAFSQDSKEVMLYTDFFKDKGHKRFIKEEEAGAILNHHLRLAASEKNMKVYEKCKRYFEFADFIDRRIGLPLDGTQGLDIRNKITSDLAKVLGIQGVVVKSEIVKVKRGMEYTTGNLMEEAEGEDLEDIVKKYNSSIRFSPLLLKEITKLRIIDSITKQCDRHVRNYKLKTADSQIVGIIGFDNDFSFNLNTDLRKSQGDLPGIIDEQGEIMLPFIDEGLANRVLKASDEEIRKTMQGLDKAYIDAAMERFRQIRHGIGKTIRQRDDFLLKDECFEDRFLGKQMESLMKGNHNKTYFGKIVEELNKLQKSNL